MQPEGFAAGNRRSPWQCYQKMRASHGTSIGLRGTYAGRGALPVLSPPPPSRATDVRSWLTGIMDPVQTWDPLTGSQGYPPLQTPAPGIHLTPDGLHSISAMPPPSTSSGSVMKEKLYEYWKSWERSSWDKKIERWPWWKIQWKGRNR